MAEIGELGTFLRGRRSRLEPADVNLPPGAGRRRTPGLRREEVATLAGISIDYYKRLEQGSETNLSRSVLDALARALLLDGEEHTHLLALANHAAHRTSTPPPPTHTVAPGVLQLLDTVRPCPAYVMTRTNDVLATNPEGVALLAGIDDWPPQRRNTIRYTFLHPTARHLFTNWNKAATDGIAQLRALSATEPDATDLAALVNELTEENPEFTDMWHRYDVARWTRERKQFRHPHVGDITVTSEVLHLEDHGQRLKLYQATPGTPDHDALRLLAAAASLR